MKKPILSVQLVEFKQDNGSKKVMWKLYCADDSGAIGCIYSTKEHKTGDTVDLGLVVNRDGKFTARILG